MVIKKHKDNEITKSFMELTGWLVQVCHTIMNIISEANSRSSSLSYVDESTLFSRHILHNPAAHFLETVKNSGTVYNNITQYINLYLGR